MSSEMSELTKAMASVVAPLTDQEAREAIDLATERLAPELSDHHRVLGADLSIDKPQHPDALPQRLVRVLVVDYAKRRTFEAAVDVRARTLRLTDLKGVQPACSQEEIAEARAIAENDPRTARFAGQQGAFVSEFGADPAPDGSRHVGLRYAVVRGGQPSAVLAHAVVDLSTRSVLDVMETSRGESGG